MRSTIILILAVIILIIGISVVESNRGSGHMYTGLGQYLVGFAGGLFLAGLIGKDDNK